MCAEHDTCSRPRGRILHFLSIDSSTANSIYNLAGKPSLPRFFSNNPPKAIHSHPSHPQLPISPIPAKSQDQLNTAQKQCAKPTLNQNDEDSSSRTQTQSTSAFNSRNTTPTSLSFPSKGKRVQAGAEESKNERLLPISKNHNYPAKPPPINSQHTQGRRENKTHSGREIHPKRDVIWRYIHFRGRWV